MRTLIKDGLVLLTDGTGWRCEKQNILIDNNRIAKITSSEMPDDCRVLDASGKLVMPGLINAHTHAYMTIHRNYADDLALFDWLEKVGKIEDGMTEEDVYWTTLLAIIEMIRSGTTCFVDMTIKSAKAITGPLSAAAGAVRDSGFRAVISRGLAGDADSDESIMKYGQALREMEMFRNESRLQFIHGPHAPYSCKADYLQKLTRSCKNRGIGQMIHLSESLAEMDETEKKHGTTPIQYVDKLGVFDVLVIAAHCVYATDEDIAIMAKKRVSIALNPKSNMKLGNGFAPAQKFISGLVYSSTGSEVDTVIVDGRILMENRKLTTINEDEVYEACREIQKRLRMEKESRL